MKKCVSLISLALAFAMSTGAFAMEVPTDTVVQNLNGSQQVIKTFKEVRIRLDLTLDVPHEIAEQLELLGLRDFEACQYDAEYQRIKMSTSTVLFREGA